MKNKLIALLALFSFSALSADKMTSAAVSATTPLTVLSGGKYTVKEILFLPTSTNGTVKFYDSASNSTNIVIGAYTSYAQYSTNWSQIFTNAAGIVVTNTFSGVATLPTTVAASTNERPAIVGPFLVTTSGRTIDGLKVQPTLGLTIYSTAAGNVEITYEQQTP